MVASGVSKSIYLEDLVMAPAIVLASKGFWTAIEKMLVGTPSRAKRAGRCLSVPRFSRVDRTSNTPWTKKSSLS